MLSERKPPRFTFAPDAEQCPSFPSEIANHLYAVVNVNTFEGVDPSLLHRADSHFEGEDLESRLSRRACNWIDNVHIDENQGVG